MVLHNFYKYIYYKKLPVKRESDSRTKGLVQTIERQASTISQISYLRLLDCQHYL